MAVWTPGSYLVREYERHVEAVTAATGGTRAGGGEVDEEPLAHRHRRRAQRHASATSVYGREMTVRNNWVEAGFAMLNGAPTFLTLAERAARPHEVRIELPAAWKGVGRRR